MPYNKTIWVNETAPYLDAENMNKIEQGIETAHLLAGQNQSAISAIPETYLSAYYTSSETDTAITDAISSIPGTDLSAYSTTVQMDTAITNAISAIPPTDLSAYSTTVQMDNAIAEAANIGSQTSGMFVMTQAEYDALPVKDTTKLYIIIE
jgi:hypothetical protein